MKLITVNQEIMLQVKQQLLYIFNEQTTLYFQKRKLSNYPTLVIKLVQSYKEN